MNQDAIFYSTIFRIASNTSYQRIKWSRVDNSVLKDKFDEYKNIEIYRSTKDNNGFFFEFVSYLDESEPERNKYIFIMYKKYKYGMLSSDSNKEYEEKFKELFEVIRRRYIWIILTN